MSTCICTRPAEGFLCRVCIRTLSHDLDTIADLWPESLTTLARLDVMPRTSGGKSKGGSSGVPLNLTASEARWVVESTIVTWLRDVAGDRIPDDVGTLPQACKWMSTYATMIGNLSQGPQLADEIGHARRVLERLVDRPKDRIVVAHCETCGKALSEEPGAYAAVCEACDEVVVVQAQRSKRVAKAQEKTVTKVDAVRVVAEAYRYRITTKTIARWIERKEITPDEDGLVKVADVLVATEKLIANRRSRVA